MPLSLIDPFCHNIDQSQASLQNIHPCLWHFSLRHHPGRGRYRPLSWKSSSVHLFCTVLYTFTVLYCTLLYTCTVFYCTTVMHCILLLYFTLLYCMYTCTVMYCIPVHLYCTPSYLYCTLYFIPLLLSTLNTCTPFSAWSRSPLHAHWVVRSKRSAEPSHIASCTKVSGKILSF